MKLALLLTLALTAIGANAQTAKVVLLNAGNTAIQFQADDRSVVATIQPNEGATVMFDQPQWMIVGRKGYRYNTPAVQRLKAKGKEIVLQLGPNATLYLMPPGTTVPGVNPPAQPKGFPIRPDRAVTIR
jgi:hypothetical protein